MLMWQIIEKHIEDEGLLKKVVARKSGINEKKFYRIVAGTQKMTVEEYEKICRDGLGLEPSYFFKLKISKNEKQTA